MQTPLQTQQQQLGHLLLAIQAATKSIHLLEVGVLLSNGTLCRNN
jgi:hypothetical protein